MIGVPIRTYWSNELHWKNSVQAKTTEEAFQAMEQFQGEAGLIPGERIFFHR